MRPATEASTAETTNTASFLLATSTPSTRRATSLSWIARGAPVGLSIRLSASAAPIKKLTAAIQYQVAAPRSAGEQDEPRHRMPSGRR